MVIECGHTFCKHCIEEWQKKFSQENPYEVPYPCPECRAVFKTVSPNASVRNYINDLTVVILNEEQKKDREETIQERLEKKNKPPIPGAGENIHLRGPLINVDDDITLESLQEIANNYGLTMSDSRAAIVAEINERLPNHGIGIEVITVYDSVFDNAEGELVDITGQIRIDSNRNATLAAHHGPIPSTHGEDRLDSNAALAAYYGLIPPSHDDITDNGTVDGDTSEDDTTDNEDNVVITEESLLQTADTIQNIFANHRHFPQLSFSSNTRELAATPAPADMERPGTGVGAIPGEEQNSESETEIENESVIEYDLEIELDSEIEPITDQVNNANTRPSMQTSYPLDDLEFMSSQWGFPRPHSIRNLLHPQRSTGDGSHPDTIQDIFANHRRFPQLLFSSNTPELAATPAPSDLDWPGTGVGAIPGEE